MDLSQIPTDVLRVLKDKRLSVPQKMMAFNLLMPGLDPEPKHAQAYLDNLEVGNTIKRMIDEGQQKRPIPQEKRPTSQQRETD